MTEKRVVIVSGEPASARVARLAGAIHLAILVTSPKSSPPRVLSDKETRGPGTKVLFLDGKPEELADDDPDD